MADKSFNMSDVSTGKSILICGIILSCFAVLWPKIFHPMLFGSNLFSTKNAVKDSLRQERSSDMHPEYAHPAFRERGKIFYGEEGRQIKRSMDKDMRAGPGPVPGMRPTFGGPGMPTPAPRSQGTMGVLMPMYTIGIIVFFVYTTMKIIFKKNDDPINEPLYSRKSLNSGMEEIQDVSESPTRYPGPAVDDYCGNSLYITKKINENVETLHHEILGNEHYQQQKQVTPTGIPEDHSISRCNDAACRQINNAKIMTDRTENLLIGNNKVMDTGDPRDVEINLLRQRLEETEKAMERIMAQMGGLVQNPKNESEVVEHLPEEESKEEGLEKNNCDDKSGSISKQETDGEESREAESEDSVEYDEQDKEHSIETKKDK
ncbi:uncharacterized protein RIC-3 isoform X2 [Lepeophtheirus salmonis]|uniref:uncharacterized protein RIC-3 isoform X2 n=1 Tax=Lepeophtheirus salmonis TaxID=72036 RepID=UPI001AE8AB29|nr:resistance to inhibitors of cholinesterase protein 3-like isoform X2 [Lepeophtheirus salmonis]